MRIVLGKCMIQVPEGNGSGVVWDGDGHIVTNYHGEKRHVLDHMSV